jgi:anti-sigma factor RsiW
MTLARLTQLLKAYGGDPRRWPDAERDAAKTFIRHSPAAQALHARAQALDDLLDAWTPIPLDDSFRSQVLAQSRAPSNASTRESITDGFPGGWWPQVAAIAAAALLGIVIGAGVLPSPADRVGEIEVAEWVFGNGLEGLPR